MTVFLKEYIHPDARRMLEEHCTVVDNFDNPDEIEAIILRSYPVDAAVMDKCKNLKLIGKHGVGCNTIDLAEAKKRGITVLNTPLANTNSVAELIVGLILNIARNITVAHEKTQESAFPSIAPKEMTGMEVSGKTLGLIGTGNIARRAAQILHDGFGVKVIGYDPFVSKEVMEKMGYEKYETVPELIAASDIVNVSVPLTPATENLIAGETFNSFKKTAILVNAARGGIVNEADLYEALKAGKLRAAACDAFVNEPPTKENTNLYELENFIGTPHIGARRGWATYTKENTGTKEGSGILLPKEERSSLGSATVSSDVVNGLALQLAIVLFCIFIGKTLFTTLAKIPIEPVANVMSKIPALLYGIVGAIILWAIMRKTHTEEYADIPTIKNIGGVALEICVCSATATLDLELFASYLAPILIHMVCIIALMSFITMVLVRRWLKKEWFELGLMAFGQGHGSTPSGLALARCVDPDSKSYNWEAFGVALGVTTPFTSTFAAVLPAVAMQSQWIIVALGGVVSLVCILFGELVVRRQS